MRNRFQSILKGMIVPLSIVQKYTFFATLVGTFDTKNKIMNNA